MVPVSWEPTFINNGNAIKDFMLVGSFPAGLTIKDLQAFLQHGILLAKVCAQVQSVCTSRRDTSDEYLHYMFLCRTRENNPRITPL